MNQQLKAPPPSGGFGVDRKQAIAGKLPTYFTGKPCKRGHVAERYTSTGNCVDCHALRDQETVSSPARPAFIPREGVVVLRSVAVPRVHLHAIRSMIDAYMAAEGLLAGPPPTVVPESNARPIRRKKKPT